MAFPKKNSRTLSVDGIRYRWMVGPDSGYDIFYAEEEEAYGRFLEVVFNNTWAGEPYSLIIKPKEAASIIRHALRLGWNPRGAGAPLRFRWKDGEVLAVSE